MAREWIDTRLPRTTPPPQRIIEVSAPVTIEIGRFRFTGHYRGMEVIPGQRTIIARDGDRAIRTPYPDCVLIMPTRSPRRGESAVRFGRCVG